MSSTSTGSSASSSSSTLHQLEDATPAPLATLVPQPGQPIILCLAELRRFREEGGTRTFYPHVAIMFDVRHGNDGERITLELCLDRCHPSAVDLIPSAGATDRPYPHRAFLVLRRGVVLVYILTSRLFSFSTCPSSCRSIAVERGSSRLREKSRFLTAIAPAELAVSILALTIARAQHLKLASIWLSVRCCQALISMLPDCVLDISYYKASDFVETAPDQDYDIDVRGLERLAETMAREDKDRPRTGSVLFSDAMMQRAIAHFNAIIERARSS